MFVGGVGVFHDFHSQRGLSFPNNRARALSSESRTQVQFLLISKLPTHEAHTSFVRENQVIGQPTDPPRKRGQRWTALVTFCLPSSIMGWTKSTQSVVVSICLAMGSGAIRRCEFIGGGVAFLE